MKHTPGPWHTDKGKSFYVFAHGSLMEQAGVENGPFVCNASTEANARIIAAAPELLNALKLACEVLRARGNTGIALHCEKAIAKAEGAV